MNTNELSPITMTEIDEYALQDRRVRNASIGFGLGLAAGMVALLPLVIPVAVGVMAVSAFQKIKNIDIDDTSPVLSDRLNDVYENLSGRYVYGSEIAQYRGLDYIKQEMAKGRRMSGDVRGIFLRKYRISSGDFRSVVSNILDSSSRPDLKSSYQTVKMPLSNEISSADVNPRINTSTENQKRLPL